METTLKPSSQVSRIISRVFVYTVFIFFTIMTLFPLIWVFYSSFKTQGEIILDQIALPKNPTLSNYPEAWAVGKLGSFAINSFLYTTLSTSGAVFVAMMTAFAFSKIKVAITGFFYNLFMIGLLITIHSVLVPLFLAESAVGLQDTHIGIIVPYIAFSLPMAIYIGNEFMKGIPDSIMESGWIDGATNWEMFIQIILPMCKPVITSIGIITALFNWNEFVLVFVLTSSDATKSLPIGIYSFSGEFATRYDLQYAALMIGTLPILLLYIFFYKKITQGVVAGAVKG